MFKQKRIVFENHYVSRQYQQRKRMVTSYKIYEAISRSKEKPTNPTSIYKPYVNDALLLTGKAPIKTPG